MWLWLRPSSPVECLCLWKRSPRRWGWLQQLQLPMDEAASDEWVLAISSFLCSGGTRIRPPSPSFFLLVPQKSHNQAGLVSLGTSIIWVTTTQSILPMCQLVWCEERTLRLSCFAFTWRSQLPTRASCLLPGNDNCLAGLMLAWQWQSPGLLACYLAMTIAWQACCLPGVDNCLGLLPFTWQWRAQSKPGSNYKLFWNQTLSNLGQFYDFSKD